MITDTNKAATHQSNKKIKSIQVQLNDLNAKIDALNSKIAKQDIIILTNKI